MRLDPHPRPGNLAIDNQGFAWLPEDDFVGHFAADVDPVKAKVMYAVQQPLHTHALTQVMACRRGGRCRRGADG